MAIALINMQIPMALGLRFSIGIGLHMVDLDLELGQMMCKMMSQQLKDLIKEFWTLLILTSVIGSGMEGIQH
eukprot:CAMPEP_0201497794 /NCGR_PEP_ID=MMETSP0151_2-20130828/67868_1 /ASSEMBLY_ACC=CAM_ASM_000257 /TAXON_ID=200890 /ORGANISM="Paramoeba atlantica, Strain 621/1 / CCAP 1560/9" /LENGTH=71 /DNA_ID=CAMNT_0047888869 /DNA_START=121 /DNA_END=333 /DNA_ORIENTATION=+